MALAVWDIFLQKNKNIFIFIKPNQKSMYLYKCKARENQ